MYTQNIQEPLCETEGLGDEGNGGFLFSTANKTPYIIYSTIKCIRCKKQRQIPTIWVLRNTLDKLHMRFRLYCTWRCGTHKTQNFSSLHHT